MRNRLIIVTILICGLCHSAFSQEYNKAGTAAAQFLKIEVGARAGAMAGAYAAIANDPYALYWNVAGISQIKRIEANFSYTNWIADVIHNFAGLVIPLGRGGNIGFSVLTLNMGEIEQTTIEDPRGTGVFINASDIAIGVSYARFMTNYVSVGLTGKYVHQQIWELSANTFAFDVGFLLHTGYKGIKLGMVLSNFGPELKLEGRNLIKGFDKWPENVADPLVQTSLQTAYKPLPTSYRVSLAIDILGDNSAVISSTGLNHLVLAVDALHPNDNPEHYSMGLEYLFADMVFIRIGYKNGTDEQGLTAGVGLQIPLGDQALILDYAYADFGIFNFVQQLSIGIGF